MGKFLTLIGLVIAIVFSLIVFLSGATNGDMKPIWPAVYGTNQTLWAGLMLIGLVLFIIGLIMVIIRVIKNRKQTQ